MGLFRPFSFVPPVQGWGEGPFVGAEHVYLAVDLGDDPVGALAVLWETACAVIPNDLVGAQAAIVGKSVGPKWEGMAVGRESLQLWWDLEDPHLNYVVTGTQVCNFFAHNYLAGEDGVRSASMSMEFPVGGVSGAVERVCDGFVEAARVSDGFGGMVGLGKSWTNFLRAKSSLRGYGPAVVALGSDLVGAESGDLVDVEVLSGGRRLLRVREGADLVAAVAKIRLMCWPGLGMPRTRHDAGADDLSFEGRSLGREYGEMEACLSDDYRRGVRMHREAMLSDAVLAGQSRRLRSAEPVERVLADAGMLLASWRRYATAMTPGMDDAADDMVAGDVGLVGDEIEVRVGSCTTAARWVLDRFFERYWEHAFNYPIQVTTDWT